MGGWQRQCLFVILLSSFLVLAVNGAPAGNLLQLCMWHV